MKTRLLPGDARIQQAFKQRGLDGQTGYTVDEEDGILYLTPTTPEVRMGQNGTTFEIEAMEVREENGVELLDLSFSSEYPVSRWGEPEVLSHDAKDMDLSRLAKVGSILLNHDPNMIVGVPTKVWLDESTRRGKLTMRWGTDEQAKWTKHKVVTDKTLRGVSVGYSVAAWVFLKDENTVYKDRIRGPAWVAASWQALEASLTPIPADPSVGVNRNQQGAIDMNEKERKRLAELEAQRAAGVALSENDRRELAVLESKRSSEPAGTTTAAAPAGTPAAVRTEPTPPVVDERAEAIKAERSRIREIRTRCQTFKLGDEFVQSLIDSGESIERCALRITDALSQRNTGSIQVTRDGRSSTAEAMYEGLMVRAGQMSRSEAKTGLHFAGFSLFELGRECMRSAGISDKGDRLDVARRMLARSEPIGRSEIELFLRKETISGSTSDFPILLAAVAYKTLMAAYMQAPIHYRKWCKIGSVSDFKDTNRIEFSESGDLLKIAELGPYVGTKFKDKQEKNRAYTYGRIFSMSRQGIINDDLGAFLGIPAAFGRKARVLPQKLALQKLLANPVLLSDNVALCAAGHTNYHADAGYALDTLAHAEAGIKYATSLMAAQKAFVHADEAASAEFLNLQPRVLLCNATDQFVARTVCRSAGNLADSKNSGVVNPIADLGLEVVPEANLTLAAWGGTAASYFMFANPEEAPVMEVVFLNGDDTPFMEEEDQTNVDGRSWKVRLDVGCEAVGYKGVVKEKGAT